MTKVGIAIRTTGAVIIRLVSPDGTTSEGTRYEAGDHEVVMGIGQGYTIEVYEAMVGEQTLTPEAISSLEETPQLPSLD